MLQEITNAQPIHRVEIIALKEPRECLKNGLLELAVNADASSVNVAFNDTVDHIILLFQITMSINKYSRVKCFQL